MKKDIELEKLFIVESEYQYWKEKVERFEKEIREYLQDGIKVKMYQGDVVGTIGTGNYSTSEITRLIKTAEGYYFSLEQFELCDKEDVNVLVGEQ